MKCRGGKLRLCRAKRGAQMKKTYSKPALVAKGRLSAVTAQQLSQIM